MVLMSDFLTEFRFQTMFLVTNWSSSLFVWVLEASLKVLYVSVVPFDLRMVTGAFVRLTSSVEVKLNTIT